MAKRTLQIVMTVNVSTVDKEDGKFIDALIPACLTGLKELILENTDGWVEDTLTVTSPKIISITKQL